MVVLSINARGADRGCPLCHMRARFLVHAFLRTLSFPRKGFRTPVLFHAHLSWQYSDKDVCVSIKPGEYTQAEAQVHRPHTYSRGPLWLVIHCQRQVHGPCVMQHSIISLCPTPWHEPSAVITLRRSMKENKRNCRSYSTAQRHTETCMAHEGQGR